MKTIWIHGTSLHLDVDRQLYPSKDPPYIHQLVRTADGTYIKGNPGGPSGDIWVHLPIPAQTTDADMALHVSSVLVAFESTAPDVTAVHLFDGKNKVAYWDQDFPNAVPFTALGIEKEGKPSTIPISFGLNVAIRIHFSGYPPQGDLLNWSSQSICVRGAGCEVEYQ